MSATTSGAVPAPAERRDRISFARLLWVGPLTVVVALLVNLAIKYLVQALDPSLRDMGQLGRPLVTLTVEFAIAAVVVFAAMAWLVPRPIFWYRIVAVVALLISLLPDIGLGLGGSWRQTGSAVMRPFISVGAPAPSGPRPAGPPPGTVLPALPWDQVLVLMLLHVATAVVCLVMLTTLTREPAAER